MLILEVEAINKILFGSLSSGISTKTKRKLALENIAPSVNEVGADSPTVADIRKKWSDIKLNIKKKKVSAHRRSIGQTGSGELLFVWTHADDRLFPYTQGVNNMYAYIIRNRLTGSLMD